MAIQRELWVNAITENLWKGFEAMRHVGTDDSTFVESKTIHIPAAGSTKVTRGNVTYPVTAVEREDHELSYDLTNFEIGPVRLGWADGLQLSYNKVQSVTNDFMGNMAEHMQRYICSQWYSYQASTLVSTSGATATNWLTGASANTSLHSITGADVRSAAEILDRDKFPMNDRFLILDYKMFWQLLGDLTYNPARLEIVAGLSATIDNIYGFKVIQFPYVAAIGITNGIVVPEATDGSIAWTGGNRPLGLAFHKSAVSFAFTGIKPFTNNDDSSMFGDILSASVYGGGKYRRYGKEGVVGIKAIKIA